MCEESQRYIFNFMAVHRLRPVDGEDEDHVDDQGNADDEELEVSHEQLFEARELPGEIRKVAPITTTLMRRPAIAPIPARALKTLTSPGERLL